MFELFAENAVTAIRNTIIYYTLLIRAAMKKPWLNHSCVWCASARLIAQSMP